MSNMWKEASISNLLCFTDFQELLSSSSNTGQEMVLFPTYQKEFKNISRVQDKTRGPWPHTSHLTWETFPSSKQLDKGMAIHLNKYISSAKFGWNRRNGSGEQDFKSYNIFAIISHLKRTWPFIWTHLNFLLLKIVLSQACILKLAKQFRRRRFSNVFNVVSLFRYYLHLEKVVDLYLNKIESHHPSRLCVNFSWKW